MVEAWRASELPVQHLINTGEEALEAGDFEDALKWSGRAHWINPKWWKPWYLAGEVYREQEAWEYARKAILIAWEQNPAQTTTALAEVLRVQDDHQTLESILKQSLTNAPNAADRLTWWTILGEILREQERWEQAVEVYQNAIEEYPLEFTFSLGLGWAIYYSNGDVELVQELFMKAIRLKPQNGTSYFAMGEILAKEARYTEADPWFRKAIERNPDIRWWHIIRGNTARDGGNLSLAINIYEASLGIFPDNGQLYYEIAWAYYLDGQFTKAANAIDDALRLIDPPNKWYYLRAGAIYEAVGDHEDALAAYRQVLVLEPDNDSASASVERLEKELDLQNP
jgi:tetratricopeptide (TPR) repeat protein